MAGAEDSDDVAAEREANRQYVAFNSAEAVVPLFGSPVGQILCDHTAWIGEGELCHGKGDAVLVLVLSILLWVPFKAGRRHSSIG